jgi:uncharacterized secreted protein with C-terminal beta-propeller domain
MKNIKIQPLLPIAMMATFFSISIIAQELPSGTISAALENIDSCPALLTELKATAIKEMEEQVDANYQSVRENGFCYKYGYFESKALPDYAPAESAAPQSESAAEYSETNVQVVGVDEADFVKNDGTYIYILANGQFRIVAAWPPEEASEIAAFPIEGEPKKLFVHDQRAFIYSSLARINQTSYYNGTECTYGYNCDFTGDGRALKVTVLDISDVTAPHLMREMHFSGAYLNSRRITNAVYSVVIFPEPEIGDLQFWPDNQRGYSFCNINEPLSNEEVTTLFESLKAENRKLIQATELTDWLPSIKDVHYNADGIPQENHNLLESCPNFYRSKQGKNFLSIISTDINGVAPLNATTILGKPGAVYASHSALYVAARHSQNTMHTSWFFRNKALIDEASTIHKFQLMNEPPASQYIGSGVVKGRVLNQFAMDEQNGFLRIATTIGKLPNTHSTLSILAEQANELVVVGQMDNIAPTEDIRSVRFMGNKGFVVTFKTQDPLFVFDLSNPYKPAITGELKIPGFSTYMHRLDDNHLLTIGYDTDDQGSFAWFQGIMLQIFDVSDMTNPLLIHKEIIGTRGSTSEAATNHLAFNYFGSKGLLAIPMTICERDEQLEPKYGGSYGEIMRFSGLLVYAINVETGFELLGGVPHNAPESEDNYRRTCSNWWTGSNSYVKRSIFMDDYVFSITDKSIKANSLSALGEDISVIHFDEQSQCDTQHIHLCTTEPACQASNGQWDKDICRLPQYLPLSSSQTLNNLATPIPSTITSNPVVTTTDATELNTIVNLPSVELPTTGTISNSHNYGGQTVTDITVEAKISLSHVDLAGKIVNEGRMSNITVLPKATLTGGIISGFIQNQGTIADTHFVGAKLVGGELKGEIVVTNKVGLGILQDVTVLPNASVTGGTLAGEINNQGTLSNLTVKSQATVTGGLLQGAINNKGLLQDVTFGKQTTLKGGHLSGSVTGNADDKALIEKTKILDHTDLANVIIGKSTQLASSVVLGTGVHFTAVIPTDIDLTLALTKRFSNEAEAVDVSTDVIVDADTPHLLTQINTLPTFTNNNWQLAQNPQNGQLELTIDKVHFAVLPIQVTQVNAKHGVTIHEDGNVTFVTHSGRKILAQPVIQDMSALLDAFSLEPDEITVQADGTLKVKTTESWAVYRVNLSSEPVSDVQSLGLFEESLNSKRLVFADKNGQKRQQIIYIVD